MPYAQRLPTALISIKCDSTFQERRALNRVIEIKRPDKDISTLQEACAHLVFFFQLAVDTGILGIVIGRQSQCGSLQSRGPVKAACQMSASGLLYAAAG
jgi:hypothetical protein